MKTNTKFKKIIAAIMLVIMGGSTTFAMFPTSVYAANSEIVIERISNPDAGVGEADGLEEGGNRETSYAWAMTTRGDYVYIGTNKNIMGNVAQTFIKKMTSSYGLSEDAAWGLANSITNGEIPRPTTEEGGYIFKCDINTGEIKKIFTADKGVSFRMAIECDGDLFFASYAAQDIGATDSTENVKNYIYKIDEDDKITQVFESTGGASMRAACLYDGNLLFGGIDESSIIAAGDEGKGYTKLAIIKKDSEDDEKWTRIADYKDFIEYATDPALTNSAGSPIWDMCSYDGYVWAVIPGRFGFVMFKGRPAENGETANEYGWIWEEVIGKTNGINNIGLSNSVEGYTGDMMGTISSAGTPFVYNDKLYLFDFDMTITAETNALTGILMKIAGQKPVMSQYLKTMYTTLKHPQSLWCYNDETGKFNKVEGFGKYMLDNCNEYVWRFGIYNDELYITTMDSAIMYRYITTLEGSDFINMTSEEIDTAIAKMENYSEMLEQNPAIYAMYGTLLENTIAMIEEYKTIDGEDLTFNDFVVKYEDLFIELESLQTTLNNLQGTGNEQLDTALTDLKEIFSKIDITGLKMYAYIVRLVENDVMGFDMFKTSDGVNFEVVTDDGFGDPYNYGGRSLVTTSEGLYIGTANPFYGAQLWRLRNEIEEDTTPEPENPNNPEDSEDPTDSEGKTDPEDDTLAPGTLPNTGKIGIIITLAVVLAVGVIVTKKYIKYKDI